MGRDLSIRGWKISDYLKIEDSCKLLYVAFAFVFFTFGLQKLLPGSSPVSPDVRSFLVSLGITVNNMWPLYFIGLYESYLGLLFYFRRLKPAAILFIPHQLVGFTPLIVIPGIAFSAPWFSLGSFSAPYSYDWFAAFILKNVIFVAAFILLLSIESEMDMEMSRTYKMFGGFMVLLLVLSAGHAFQNPNGTHLGNYRVEEGEVLPRFSDVTADYGVDYTVSKPHERRLFFGGGVYSSDINQDGRYDLLLTGGDRPVVYINHRSRFVVKQLPRTEFNDIISAHFVDLDRDGYEDLILFPSGSEPLLFRNNGGELVYERKLDVRMENPLGAVSADINRNGCLDVFVYQTSSDSLTKGGNNHLFRNPECGFDLEHSRVMNSSIAGGAVTNAASFYDFTGNGYPDLHVANDFRHDIFYLNINGSLQKRKMKDFTHREAMSSEVADISGDGEPDIFVTNINRNNLLVNDGKGNFTDLAGEYNVLEGEWGWSAVAEDLDNDGETELFHTTSESFGRTEPALWERKGDRYIRFRGHGLSSVSGAGVVPVDLQGDGVLDLVRAPRYLEDREIINFTGKERINLRDQTSHNSVKLYKNLADGNNFIRIKPELETGSPAIGAEVTIKYEGGSKTRYLDSGADFLSQDPPVLHFGLGQYTNVEKITVRWPGKTKTVLRGKRGNREYTITP